MSMREKIAATLLFYDFHRVGTDRRMFGRLRVALACFDLLLCAPHRPWTDEPFLPKGYQPKRTKTVPFFF